MNAWRLWSAWFEVHPEVGCWFANLGLALGGAGAVSVEPQPARCPLRAMWPATPGREDQR